MKRVIVESPFAGKGTTEDERRAQESLNIRYLRACLRDCLMRGEAPFASHGLYTQEGVLDDNIPEEREHGIQAGFAWREAADMTVVYIDRGYSSGMKAGIADAETKGRPIEIRSLPDWATE